VHYARADLSRHRPASDLFHSRRFRETRIDTLVHVPHHGAPAAAGGPLLAGVARRTAEARLVLQHALETPTIRHLVAIGSAFVYRLPPGNANRLREDSELDLDPDVPPEIRSWIDCDMLFHGEVHNDRLRVVLLRVPTVVASGGYVYLNPLLEGRPGLRLRSAGFDPICALVSDKDVARAARAAVHAPAPGIYNVAGAEAVPLSVLCRWTGRPSVPLPGPLLGWLGVGARLARQELTPLATGHPRLRYGFTLDTRRAARELGFHPRQRVGLARGGDGQPILETAAV
jgi:UDP-glucose 4-epimerase